MSENIQLNLPKIFYKKIIFLVRDVDLLNSLDFPIFPHFSVEMVDKFPTHLLPPSLAWMFELLEWVTKNWPNLAKQPDIGEEGMPTAIRALKQKSRDEIAQFVEHHKKNHFVHGEYPNTKAMSFVEIVENVLNKVKFVWTNVQNWGGGAH
jgi:hypothetical protein